MIASGEGLGNSFWIAQAEELLAADLAAGAYAVEVCAGAEPRDGLLIVDSVDADGIQAATVINRDGSPGGVCLNGLRVLAIWSGRQSGVFRMGGRLVPWRRLAEEVELHLLAEDLPDAFWSPIPLQVAGRSAFAVSFWNPHCVIPVASPRQEDLDALAEAATAATAAASRASAAELPSELQFPNGVNVELIGDFASGCISMRVQERGVGETQACGSGAVAAAVVAWAVLEAPHNEPLTVQIPGGNLHLRQDQKGGIFLRGAATARPLKGNP